MKIHRFTGATTQKAMAKIHEELGLEALIYSTRNVDGTIEILAALPHSDDNFAFETFKKEESTEIFPVINEEFTVGPSQAESALIQKLNHQLQIMDDKVSQLSNRIQSRFVDEDYLSDDENIKSNVILYHLAKLGFRGRFCQEFLRNFVSTRMIFDTLDEKNIQRTLLSYIKTSDSEFIDKQNVCALIGPTGIGKTTTIAKLAKRFISKYGPAALGLITTDYHDIASKNQLVYYSHLLNVDLEYANDPKELALALHAMRDKKLVLIDTYGVSQRDPENLAQLRSFLESQGERISTYITLPCNVQEDILNDIAHEFKTTNLRGCILTKQDESISIAPAVSVCMNHQMKIAYICNGQNIYRDIKPAQSDEIMQQIITDAEAKSKSVEKSTFGNAGTVFTNRDEDSYERQSGRS
jgi:flagellar biosynthesis protein FlhF